MKGYQNYKGYLGILQIDADANVIRGHVVNTQDTITFQGKAVEEAVAAFHDSVDEYVKFCESLGHQPEKPFSGKVLIRLKPDVHRRLILAAQSGGVSLNKLVSRELTKVANKAGQIVSAAPVVTAKAKQSAKPKTSAKPAGSTTH